MKTSNLLKPVSIGNMDWTDRKNCTVRALSNCLDMNIQQAKELLAKHGRKQNEGCTFEVFESAYSEAGLKFVGFFGTTEQAVLCSEISKINKNAPHHKGMTLETFCKVFNRGSYVVNIKGHNVCVRGGKIIDTQDNIGGRSVICAWKRPEVFKGYYF